jgi:hypothetical protein
VREKDRKRCRGTIKRVLDREKWNKNPERERERGGSE